MHHYPMAGPRSRYAYSRIVASPQQFLHTSLGYPQEVASPHLSVDSVSAEWYPIFTEVRRLSKSCKICRTQHRHEEALTWCRKRVVEITKVD